MLKIDFQIGGSGCHLAIAIGTILAISNLQASYQVFSQLISGVGHAI